MKILLLQFLLCLSEAVYAQSVFSDVSLNASCSDRNDRSTAQHGLEILGSSVGVRFDPGASFEHVGQFYVAEDGIWNPSGTEETDYFGYAPADIGSYLPYQGKGIMGASPTNGGKGAGRPTFSHLQLNSTGQFPIMGGIYIMHSLDFNVNGPGQSSIITTPNCSSSYEYQKAVIFASTSTITGSNALNYIGGFASVSDVIGSFTLPIGDSNDPVFPLHPLTVNNDVHGTITACYRYKLSHPITSLGTGIGSVSPTGCWPISAPEGTRITVNVPTLLASQKEIVNLRLVGWNGHQWVDLSGSHTSGVCTTGDCPLTGTIQASISSLAIGSSTNFLSVEGESISLTLWPNPTKDQLHLQVTSGQFTGEITVLDMQGRSVFKVHQMAPSLDTSTLPPGIYILEVKTLKGGSLRKYFVKQH